MAITASAPTIHACSVTVASRFIYGRAVFAYWPVDHFGSLSISSTTESENEMSVQYLPMRFGRTH